MKSRTSLSMFLSIAVLAILSGPVFAAIWYVDGTTSGDGTSWAQAFETITEAVADANALDEIWVKAGTYAISSQIEVYEAVGIYGGFTGNETERSHRDWVNNTTTIDGQDITRILKLTDEPIIDGFTLTRGYYEVTEATGGGGAVYMGGIGAWDKTAHIRNCIISNNTVYADPIGTEGFKGGGAIYIGTGNPIFTNCLVINNITNAYGGAANFYGGSPRFNNCTISNNTALKGGGLYLQGVDTTLNAQFYNCIVRGNIGTSDANDVEVKAGGDDPMGNNNCSSVPIGSGTILADPLFIDADSDDFHLRAGSPCIDAGDSNSVPAEITEDLDGRPRFINDPNTGNGLTPTVDIGAYEFGDLNCGFDHLTYPIGDLNSDCSVNFLDFAILTLCWLTQDGEPGWDHNCNLYYTDLIIDEYDLVVLSEHWLDSTAPPLSVGHWKMDDNAADTVVVDSSSYGNDGTAQQNTSDINTTGIIDDALSFNGIDDYILVADSESLSPTQEVTVCGWFWFNDTTANTGLIWKHSYNYALWTASDTVRFAAWNASSEGSTAIFSTSLLEAGWNFIAGVFDGTNSKLYLNGAGTGSVGDSITGPIRDNAGDLYIGYRPGQDYYDGVIDDVRIFNQALTQEEIMALYNLVP